MQQFTARQPSTSTTGIQPSTASLTRSSHLGSAARGSGRHRILAALGAIAAAAVLICPATTGTAHAAGSTTAQSIASLATANVGKGAGYCSTVNSAPNSLGGTSFDGSCTDNGGRPVYWCADFARWVWRNAGVNVVGLSASAGSFVANASLNGSTVHTSATYAPQVGDAVVYDLGINGNPPDWADHVGLVTAVGSDGSVTTVNGDFGGSSSDEVTFAETSRVQLVTIPAGQSSVGSKPAVVGMTITDYVTPGGVTQTTSATAHPPTQPVLARFGGGTWTFYMSDVAPGNGQSGAASTGSYVTWSGGLSSDHAMMVDWQGIGKAQPALARFANGTWTYYLSNASPGLNNHGTAATDSFVTWSGTLATDVPMMVDWQGIGKAQPALARFANGTWTYYLSSASPGNGHSGAAVTDSIVTWSGTLATDAPMMVDWQGIGKAQPALARFANGTWTYYLSSASPGNGHSGAAVTDSFVTWSGVLASDHPAMVDWQGIGKAQPALARFANGTWTYYLSNASPGNGHSGSAVTDSFITWSGGLAGDTPIEAHWV